MTRVDTNAFNHEPLAMHATLTHLFIKAAHKQPMVPKENVSAISLKGLEGDVAFGKRRRQVLLIEGETLEEFDLQPGMVRENGVTRGIVLAGMAQGTRLRVGRAVLEVTMDCEPCPFMETLRPGLEKAMDGRRGTLFKVVEGGPISIGDSVEVSEVVTA